MTRKKLWRVLYLIASMLVMAGMCIWGSHLALAIWGGYPAWQPLVVMLAYALLWWFFNRDWPRWLRSRAAPEDRYLDSQALEMIRLQEEMQMQDILAPCLTKEEIARRTKVVFGEPQWWNAP